MEVNRAAADRGGDKTTNMGLDWPHTEETRRLRGPLSGTGRGNGREGDPDSPGGAENVRVRGERTYVVRGKSHCTK